MGDPPNPMVKHDFPYSMAIIVAVSEYFGLSTWPFQELSRLSAPKPGDKEVTLNGPSRCYINDWNMTIILLYSIFPSVEQFDIL